MKAHPSHPYTLASRTSQSANQNLPKSMAAPSHGQTEENKARAHNKVYKSLGSKWLIESWGAFNKNIISLTVKCF